MLFDLIDHRLRQSLPRLSCCYAGWHVDEPIRDHLEFDRRVRAQLHHKTGASASGGDPRPPDFLKHAQKARLRRHAHGSIRVQEGQLRIRLYLSVSYRPTAVLDSNAVPAGTSAPLARQSGPLPRIDRPRSYKMASYADGSGPPPAADLLVEQCMRQSAARSASPVAAARVTAATSRARLSCPQPLMKRRSGSSECPMAVSEYSTLGGTSR